MQLLQMKILNAKIQKIILPFINEVIAQRKNYLYYTLLINAMQVISCLIFFLSAFENQADSLLTTLIGFMKSSILQNYYLAATFTYLAIMYTCILIFAGVYLRSNHQTTIWKPYESNKIIQGLCFIYLILEIVIEPAFLIMLHNIKNHLFPQLTLVNILTLPFLMGLIIAERDRRIFKQYLIIIGIANLFLTQQYFPLVLCIFSTLLAKREASLVKKIVYIQIVWLEAALLIAMTLEVKLNFVYTCIISIQIGAVCLFTPNEDHSHTYLQDNDMLLHYIENNDFPIDSKTSDLQISKIINTFKELLLIQKLNKTLTKQQNQLLENQQLKSKQYLLKFLTFKINEEMKMQKNISLEIQNLQCHLLDDPFSIKLLQQIQKLNVKIQQSNRFTDKLKICKIIQKVEVKYLRSHTSTNAIVLIESQSQLQKFYSAILEITQIIMKFWAAKQKNTLTVLEMKRFINQILILQIQLKNNMDKLQQLRPCKIQSQIYKYIMKLINNSSKEMHQPQNHKHNDNEIQNQANLNFILIQTQRIVGISNQMAIQMHMDKIDIIGKNTNYIFPQQMKSCIAFYLKRAIETQKKIKPIILPILIGPQQLQIQPYRCRFQIFPHLTDGIKYIIYVYPSEDLHVKPTFLYNSQDDRILYISSNLFSYFGIDSQERSCMQTFGQEIFDFDIGEIFLQQQKIYKASNQQINCTLNLNKLSNTTHSQSINIEIKCLQLYKLQLQCLMLIEVKKKQVNSSVIYQDAKSNINNFLQEQKSKSISENKYNCFIGGKFCKIVNPYENVIDQKILRIKQLNKLSYLKITLIVLLINILLFAIILIILGVEINNNMDALLSRYNQNNQNGNQISSIIQSIYKYLNYYQLINYPISYEEINRNINITAITQMYQIQINKALQSQTSNAILNDQEYTLASYTVQFSDFTIISSTQSTGLIDFLQNIKLAMKNNSPQFLIVNSNSLEVIINNIPFTTEDIISDVILLLNQLIIGEIVIIFLNFVVLRFILYKIRDVNISLLDLLAKIDDETIIKIYKQMKQFANSLQISNDKKQKQHKMKYDFFSTIDVKDSSSQKNHKTLIQTIKNNNNIKTKRLNDKQEEILLNKLNQIQSQQCKNKNGKYKYSHNFVIDNLMIVVSLIILVFLLFMIDQVNQCQEEFHNIFETQLNFIETINSIELSANKFYTSGMMQTLPQQKRRVWQINRNQTLITTIDQILPQFYSDFQAIEVKTLNYNLCTFINKLQTRYGTQFNCSDILGDVLTAGFESSTDLYLNLIDNFGHILTRDYGKTYRIGAKYPVFFQVTFLNQILTSALTQLLSQFSSITKTYIQQWRSFLILLEQLAILLCPIIIGVSYLHYSNISEQCKFGLKIFILIPRNYLLKMSTTKVLKNSKILDQIQWLAF